MKEKLCFLKFEQKNIHLWFSSSRQIDCVAARVGVAFEAKSLSSDGYLDTIFQDGKLVWGAIVSVVKLHEVEKWLEGQILAWLVQDLPKIVLMRQSSIFTPESENETFWVIFIFCEEVNKEVIFATGVSFVDFLDGGELTYGLI